MDPLSSYLARKGETLSAFAARIGRSPSTLTRVLGGARNPSMDLARDVERGTDGQVTAIEFLSLCMDRPVPHDADRVSTASPDACEASGPALSVEAAE
jgi:DNA-binding transcriptional regulator YdaS (Cro superfamily)